MTSTKPVHRTLAATLAALSLLALAACGTPATPDMSATAANGASSASANGVVQSVERVDKKDAGIGVGAIAGVVVSSPVPRNRMDGDQAYRLTLRMDDGSQQVFATDTDPGYRVGDRIQVVNGIVQHY